uniref:VWFA domain-containing protein n=1 Tax=Macrostomum lignano TaxID=282301 RepID=A0A1I8IU13_9PLAT
MLVDARAQERSCAPAPSLSSGPRGSANPQLAAAPHCPATRRSLFCQQRRLSAPRTNCRLSAWSTTPCLPAPPPTASAPASNSSKTVSVGARIAASRIRRCVRGQAKLNSCSQKADIFFALDSSHSVGRRNFALVTKFIHEIVSKLLRKSSNFRFGVVIFSDKADMVIKLKDYSMRKPAERKAMLQFLLHDLEYKSGKTVTEGERPPPEAKPVVVLLTDGRANGRANPVAESNKLRKMGASVLALGIGTGISRSALEKLASNKKYVTVVNDFEDLGKVGKVITDILCEGGKAASVKDFKSCGKGLQMIARECVPLKPKCSLKCPKGFMLVVPCKCVPNVSVSDDCRKSCKESEILVKGCVCVPRHVPSKPKKAKVCKKSCKGEKKLNAKLCACECKKKCPGRNFDQKSDCRCECKMRCRKGLALNKATCTCRKVDCPPKTEFFDGKCMPKVRKYCPPGQILFRDICKKAIKCPKGYKLRSDRKCYKVGCDPGFKKTKDGRCVKMCTGKKYYYKGKCNEPTPCPGHQYFRVRGSGCPRTCNEPVLFSKCPKERRPQCECRPYFLLHKGKCVHPSDCPNVPICIQKADVIFMLDSSLTVTEHNFYIMKNFVRDVVQQFYMKNGERQRIGVMRFSHKNKIVMDLDSWEHNSHEEILKKIEAMQYEPGLTFLGEALHEVRTKMWQKHAGMREDVPHVTILLTDGAESNGEVDQFYESKLVRRSGVFFVTIAIGEQSKQNRAQLAKLAGPEGRVFIFGLREFQDIHGLVARVLTFHCERPLCPHPYLINGDCVGNYKSIHRVEYVPKGYGCKKVVKQDFKKVRCACPKPDTKAGPCEKMFKKITTTYFKLNKKKGICESSSKDSRVRCGCPGPKKTIGKCENQYRKTTILQYKLISGGESGGHCKAVTKTKTARCACPKPTRKYLPCVNNFKIMYETFYEFNRLTRGCIQRRRTKEIRCSCPKPAVETGHCNGKIVPIKVYTQRVNSRNQCDDILWTGSAKCKRTCSKRMDVAFLIDSSDSVRGRNFEHIRRFIVAVAKKLDVSRDNTHVALLKFSSVQRMKVIFNYVAHYHLDSMTTRVMEMEYSPGSTYTGDAIKAFRRFLLNKVNGYRGGESKGAESVVILVTDGASNSKVDPIKEAAKVKALGCRIITVGVGDDIQAKQLDSIATVPHGIHSFKTSTFSELVEPQFVDDIISATCRVGKVNKVSMKAKYTNKIRDLLSRNVEINWEEMGFKKVDPKDLAQFEFTVKGSYVSTVGDSQKQKSKFLSAVRNGLAKALRIHPYTIRKLYVSRKLLVSGLVRSSKIEKLKSLVEEEELKLKVGKTKLKIDSSSFSTLPYGKLESIDP